MNDNSHSVSGEARLESSKDKQVGIRWPVALDKRLDELVTRANGAGARTNRRELIAALLLDSDRTEDELLGLVLSYRRALVRDAPLERPTADVLKFPAQRPGPRVNR